MKKLPIYLLVLGVIMACSDEKSSKSETPDAEPNEELALFEAKSIEAKLEEVPYTELDYKDRCDFFVEITKEVLDDQTASNEIKCDKEIVESKTDACPNSVSFYYSVGAIGLESKGVVLAFLDNGVGCKSEFGAVAIKNDDWTAEQIISYQDRLSTMFRSYFSQGQPDEIFGIPYDNFVNKVASISNKSDFVESEDECSFVLRFSADEIPAIGILSSFQPTLACYDRFETILNCSDQECLDNQTIKYEFIGDELVLLSGGRRFSRTFFASDLGLVE